MLHITYSKSRVNKAARQPAARAAIRPLPRPLLAACQLSSLSGLTNRD